MLYRFSDIDSEDVYNSDVVIIAGKHTIFNNIVLDRLRDKSKGDYSEEFEAVSEDMLSEFTVGTAVSKSVSLAEFMGLKNQTPLVGKWFCHIIYDSATAKEKDTIKEYLKKPTDNGILVVTAMEYTNIVELRRLGAVKGSKVVAMIELSFPNTAKLQQIVTKMFADKGYKVSEDAVKLFIMRLSDEYDTYSEVIESIVNKAVDNVISYGDMKEYTKDYQSYMMDDFINQLLVPQKGIKVYKKRKIYKMLESVADDGYWAVVRNMRYRIDDLIEMRLQINNEIVPTKVRYSITEVKESLGKDNRLYKLNKFKFRKLANVASQTSLKDWYYIKMLLYTVKNGDEYGSLCALISIIHRGALSNERILNDLKIKNIIEEELYPLNSVLYRKGDADSNEM